MTFLGYRFNSPPIFPRIMIVYNSWNAFNDSNYLYSRHMWKHSILAFFNKCKSTNKLFSMTRSTLKWSIVKKQNIGVRMYVLYRIYNIYYRYFIRNCIDKITFFSIAVYCVTLLIEKIVEMLYRKPYSNSNYLFLRYILK